MARPFALAIVGAITLGFMFFGLFHRVARVRYQTLVALRLAYGSGPRAVGTMRGTDARPYGPMSFAVQGGSIAVLDEANGRILIFMEGHGTPRMVEIHSRKGIDVDLAAGGHLYWLAWDGAVYEGERQLFAIPVHKGEVLRAERLHATRLGGVYVQVLSLVQGRQEQQLWFWNPGRAPQLLSAGVQNFAVGPQGALHWTKAGFLYAPSGRSLGRVRGELVGVDRSGAVAFGQNLGTARARVEILGRRRALRLPTERTPYLNVYARMTAQGDVFIAAATARGYEIVRFQRMTYHVYVPRFW